MLDSNTIKNETIGILETSAGGLFDFEKMPDHIKYEQEDDGRAKLNSNNEVIILKQYEQPALELILSAIDNGIIEAFKTSGTLDDFSDVKYNNLSKNDLLIYDGVDWVNSSVSGINLSGNNVSSHKIPLNYVPKSDGLGGWKSTNIYEDVNGLIKIKYGTSINEFSIDGTLAGNSDLTLPTEKAVKTYVDSNAAHNLLSTRHSDTLADSVVDGSIIIGNATPKWSRLAISIPAANVRNVLGIDSGELRPSWKTALDGTTPATIAVGGAGTAGTSLVFSHRDHNHPAPSTWTATAHNILDSTYHGDTLTASVVDGDVIIGNVTPKWSKLAISIPAANVRNVLGIDNGELRPSWKTALDSTNPTTIGINDTAAPGTSLVFAHRDHKHASPTTWTATAHNILDSTYHSDVLTGSITRGDILYGNSTPKIARLAKGNDGQYLKSGATDVAWADLPGSFSGFANPTAAVGNTVVNGSATTAMRSDAAPALGNLGTAGTHAKFAATGLADSLLSETANDVIIGSTKRFGLGAGKGGLTFTDAATDTITFDNCDVGIGTTPDSLLHIHRASAGTVTAHAYSALVVEHNDHVAISILTPNNKKQHLLFGDTDLNTVGQLYYNHTDDSCGIVTNSVLRSLFNSGGIAVYGNCVSVTPITATEYGYFSLTNTGGTVYFGLEKSIGASLFAGSAAYQCVIGHTGNYPLGLYTNNLQRLHITADGNVGIGTTAPLLNVGSATGDFDSVSGGLHIKAPTGYNARLILEGGSVSTEGYRNAANSIIFCNTSTITADDRIMLIGQDNGVTDTGDLHIRPIKADGSIKDYSYYMSATTGVARYTTKTNDSVGYALQIYHDRSGLVLSNADVVGSIDFIGYVDNGGLNELETISQIVSQYRSANGGLACLNFYTNETLAMYIEDHGGSVVAITDVWTPTLCVDHITEKTTGHGLLFYNSSANNFDVMIQAIEARDAMLTFICDDGDDAADKFRLRTVFNSTSANNLFKLQCDNTVKDTFVDLVTVTPGGNFGIGTTGPGGMGSGGTFTALQVHNSGIGINSFGALSLSSGSTANGGIVGALMFGVPSLSGTDQRTAQIVSSKDDALTVNPVGSLFFSTANGAAPAERMRITSTGNVGIGTTTFDATAAKCLSLGNGTAPASPTANQIYLYSVSGDLYVLDEDGYESLLSPHNERGEWVFKCENKKTGGKIEIDAERFFKWFDKEFKTDFVKEC